VLLQVNDESARLWYATEAAQEAWSVKTLQRNISSQYYYRLLQTSNPAVVEAE
jgi:predicted nuclease of restriction endonuclease-like (RecB) superfamily